MIRVSLSGLGVGCSSGANPGARLPNFRLLRGPWTPKVQKMTSGVRASAPDDCYDDETSRRPGCDGRFDVFGFNRQGFQGPWARGPHDMYVHLNIYTYIRVYIYM